MAAKKMDIEGPERYAARMAREAQQRRDAKTAPGPNLIKETCCDCAKFGPWNDSEFFYCTDHVPPSLRNRGNTYQDAFHHDGSKKSA